MEDILVVEKVSEVFHVRSKSDRFTPQTCATEDLLFGNLVSKGMMREEFISVLAQVLRTGRTEIEVRLPVPLSQL
jgi:hypothetical protein